MSTNAVITLIPVEYCFGLELVQRPDLEYEQVWNDQ